ncbi:MAG: hypothetical protein U5R48_02385 [Gammaproteobacteria bacterium]|nr:hypothetical protein [Gammaproteobacteria bacterium]
MSDGVRQFELSKRVAGMELLYEVGLALTAERNHDRLIRRSAPGRSSSVRPMAAPSIW